jgi:hypothetical protein
LTISLESTLLSDAQEELKYRLATRCAALLADDHDPQQTHFFAKKVYDARSKLVHQGALLERQKLRVSVDSTDEVEPRAFVRKAETLARTVLRHYIRAAEEGRSSTSVTKSIDQQILKRLAS